MKIINIEGTLKEIEESQEKALDENEKEVYFLLGCLRRDLEGKRTVAIDTKEIREQYRKEVYENEDQESRFDNLASMFFILVSLLEKLEEV